MTKLFSMNKNFGTIVPVLPMSPLDPSCCHMVNPPLKLPIVSATGFVYPSETLPTSDGLVLGYPSQHLDTWRNTTCSIPFIYNFNERVQLKPSLVNTEGAAFGWVIKAIKYLIYPQAKHVDQMYAKYTTQHNLLSGLNNHFKGIATLDVSSLLLQALTWPSPPPGMYCGTAIKHIEFANWLQSALVNDVSMPLFIKILSVMYGQRICNKVER